MNDAKLCCQYVQRKGDSACKALQSPHLVSGVLDAAACAAEGAAGLVARLLACCAHILHSLLQAQQTKLFNQKRLL